MKMSTAVAVFGIWLGVGLSERAGDAAGFVALIGGAATFLVLFHAKEMGWRDCDLESDEEA